jgi:hypothetical protein
MKQLFTAPLKLLIWCAIKILLSSQYIVYHLKQKLLAGESKMHQRASHPYHCVEIDPLESEGTYLNSDTDTEITVCSCVKKQEGTRYLSQSAPHLPLSGCDCKKCDCRYKHYEDRRNLVRSSSDETYQLYCHLDSKKRESNDRRQLQTLGHS